jgi:hypothetical protein
MVFDNVPIKTYMQVWMRGTYWLRQWMQVQRHEEHAKELTEACKALKATMMQIFALHSWRFSNKITAS